MEKRNAVLLAVSLVVFPSTVVVTRNRKAENGERWGPKPLSSPLCSRQLVLKLAKARKRGIHPGF